MACILNPLRPLICFRAVGVLIFCGFKDDRLPYEVKTPQIVSSDSEPSFLTTHLIAVQVNSRGAFNPYCMELQ